MLARCLARSGLLVAVAVCVAATATVPTLAQGRAPKGPVEITVGSSAGGTPDVIMRTVVKIMTEEKIVNIPVAVQNRPGGSWANAYNFVLGKKGDENVLLTLASPVFLTPVQQGQPSVVDQLTPIAGFIQSELVLLVQPNSPYKTMKDLIEAAKANPGKLRVAGAQTASTDHLATALIEKAGGVKFTYIPYDGGSAALASFLGGNVEITYGTLEEGLPVFQGGKARALAIMSEKRRPEAAYKDIPTMKELGYDVVFGQFWGVAGPPGLDPEVAKWWEDKFKKVVETKAWKDGLTQRFQRSDFYGGAEAGKYFQAEQTKFRNLMEAVGLAKK